MGFSAEAFCFGRLAERDEHMAHTLVTQEAGVILSILTPRIVILQLLIKGFYFFGGTQYLLTTAACMIGILGCPPYTDQRFILKENLEICLSVDALSSESQFIWFGVVLRERLRPALSSGEVFVVSGAVLMFFCFC